MIIYSMRVLEGRSSGMVISTSQPLGLAIIGISYRHMKGKIIMHYKIVRGKAGYGYGFGSGLGGHADTIR